MAIDAPPSKYGLPSRWPKNTPRNAMARPSSAAESSKTTVNRLGSLVMRTKRAIPVVPRALLNCRSAKAKDDPSTSAEIASTM